MRAALAALALCASWPAFAAADGGREGEPAASRPEDLPDAGAVSEDDAVIRDLELLESLEVLKRMEVLEPEAAGRP